MSRIISATFLIDADKVAVRIHLRQTYRVLAFAAGQLQRNRVVVFKMIFPRAFDVFRVLQHVAKRFNLGKAHQFFLTHKNVSISF